MTELIQRLEHLAARLAATTEHHGYAHMVIEAVEAIKTKSLRSEIAGASEPVNIPEGYRQAIRKAAIEECVKLLENAELTYFGPDPVGVSNLRDLIIEAVRALTNAAPQAASTPATAYVPESDPAADQHE